MREGGHPAREALRRKRGLFRAQRVARRDDLRVPTMTGGHLSSPVKPLDVAPCFAAVVGRDVRAAEHGGHCAGHEPDLSTRYAVPSRCGRRVASSLEAHGKRFSSYLLYIAAIYTFPPTREPKVNPGIYIWVDIKIRPMGNGQ